MSSIIFNSVAETHFLQHLQIVFGAHSQPLRFKKFVLRFEFDDPLLKLFADGAQRAIQLVCRGYELFGGKKCNHVERFVRMTGQRIKSPDRINLVTEKLNANWLRRFRGENIEDASPKGKLADHHASLAKAFCTAKSRETVSWGRELLGGNGIVADYNVARFFADAEALYSYEGTYQMQNLIVGKAITGIGAFV